MATEKSLRCGQKLREQGMVEEGSTWKNKEGVEDGSSWKNKEEENGATYESDGIQCTQKYNRQQGTSDQGNATEISNSNNNNVDIPDVTKLSCSQLLQMIGQQENVFDSDDRQVSHFLLDMPISSYTGLLTAADDFENSMVITTSRITDAPQCTDNANMMEEIRRSTNEQDVLHHIEEDFEDNWDLDLFKHIHESQEIIEQHTLAVNHTEEGNEDGGAEGNEETDERDFLQEEDVDNFLENEKIASSETNNSDIDSQYIPEEGMEFSTSNEAHKFFNDYAYQVGFAAIIAHHARTQSKKRNGEVIRITYKCNRQGTQNTSKEGDTQEEQVTVERDTNVLVKTDCKCCMVISERKGMWRITRLVLEHNHALSPGAKFFRAHKNMTEQEKKLIRTLNECNIPTKKMMYLLSFLRGGLGATPYRDKDISNYRGKIKRETSQNDMMQALMYFLKKKEEDPSFQYKFLVDKENKVKCIFWTDPKSIRYYQEYGDCVTFDTTYLTNKYRMPFAPFAGITGHGLTCIFGCALISDETTETFQWLFATFLEAMGGKEPKSVMTDQDNAMRSAIAQIFQHANHRNCVFHIKYKAELKHGRSLDKENLREELYDIIDNSITKEEFEIDWQETIKKHGIEHIKYFQDIFDSRHRWAPVWFKQEFYPFINTTARSEGTNARYKRTVGPQYSITSFLKEYERIQETIYDNEEQADHETNTKKKSRLWSNYYMERQAHEAYNLKIFKKFQWQLRRATKLQADEVQKDKMYLVYTSEDQTLQELRMRKYIVTTDVQSEDLSCICGKFQKDGMLCCHILKVMMRNDIMKILDKYIIDRWRKKEKKMIIKRNACLPAEATALRYNNLSLLAAEMNSEGSRSEEKYKYLTKEIERLTKELKQMDLSKIKETEAASIPNQMQTTSQGNNIGPSIQLLDPDIAATKGRPAKLKSNKRTIPKAEQMRRKKKEKYDCEKCKSSGHNTATCTIDFTLTKQPQQTKKKVTTKRNQHPTENREQASEATHSQRGTSIRSNA